MTLLDAHPRIGVCGKDITDCWLSQQSRPIGITPRSIRVGDAQARGYAMEDCMDAIRRHISKAALDTLTVESRAADPPPGENGTNGS